MSELPLNEKPQSTYLPSEKTAKGRKYTHPPGQLRVVGFEDQLNLSVLGDLYGGGQAEVFVAEGNVLLRRRTGHYPNPRWHSRVPPH
jgi:hypothetical protein